MRLGVAWGKPEQEPRGLYRNKRKGLASGTEGDNRRPPLQSL